MDFSPAAIKKMQAKYPEMHWVEANVRKMDGFESESFNAVIDKGTFDALRTSREGVEHREMFAEVSRVLRPGGRFIAITYGNRTQMESEDYFGNSSYAWTPCHISEPLQRGQNTVHVFTCTKQKIG